MLNLHVVPVGSGDCLLLEYGQADRPRFLLADGGADTAYPRHLLDLMNFGEAGGGRVDLVIASRPAADPRHGLAGFLAGLHAERAAGRSNGAGIAALWHNTFRRTIGVRADIRHRLDALLKTAGGAGPAMVQTRAALAGIDLDPALRRAAARLGIAVNPGFARDRVVAGESGSVVVLENLAVRVVSPSREALDRLRRQWRDWLDRREAGTDFSDPLQVVNTDRSLPPLGGIMVLAEADGRRVLLAGGGRADHLLDGLEHTGLLQPGGTMTVDVLQLPLQGGTRPLIRRLLDRIRADCCIVPSGGRDGRPDPAALGWLAESIRSQGRRAEILVPRPSPALENFVATFPPDEYGYRLIVPAPGRHGCTLALAP